MKNRWLFPFMVTVSCVSAFGQFDDTGRKRRLVTPAVLCGSSAMEVNKQLASIEPATFTLVNVSNARSEYANTTICVAVVPAKPER